MNLTLLVPEWTAVGVFLLLLIADMAKSGARSLAPQDPRAFTALSLFGVLAVLGTAWVFKGSGTACFEFYKADLFARYFKVLFSGIAAVIMVLTYGSLAGRREKPEPFLLVLWLTLLGMFFLASANDLFLAFLTVEIVTLSFYILAAYLKRDILSIEAGLKYLIMGSLASAFMIFGVGLVYAAAGSTQLDAVRAVLELKPHAPLLTAGLLLVFCGIGFKIAAVPFHLWVPDVYQGAPVPTVAFLSVGSKAAGFAFLLRLTTSMGPGHGASWGLLFSALAAMTLAYGNLGALSQHSIKRLFGYSSIGHAGYLLIGLASGSAGGYPAVLYYLAAYAVSNLSAFTVITLVDRAAQSGEISAYSGLSKRSPLLAAVMLAALISLAGVPPTAGFFGKFLVLLAAVRNGQTWLALAGLVFVVVSLYYYLSIVRVMYAQEPAQDPAIRVSPAFRVLLLLLTAGIFALGLFQSPLYSRLLAVFP